MIQENLYDKLRIECGKKSFHSFAYAFIYARRSERYRHWVRLLKIFGVGVPAVVGATACGYGLKSHALEALIFMAIPLGIIQFTFSMAALVYEWDNKLDYAFDAQRAHSSLSERFKKLQAFPPSDFDKLNQLFETLMIELNSRQDQDTKQGIRGWEERKGMKSALREFQWKCVGCKTVALAVKTSDCPVCGNFSIKHQIFNL